MGVGMVDGQRFPGFPDLCFPSRGLWRISRLRSREITEILKYTQCTHTAHAHAHTTARGIVG